MGSVKIYLGLIIILLANCNLKNSKTEAENYIQLWYGKKQQFGHLGNPQKQINILGNIRYDAALDDLKVYYTLNNKPEQQSLTLGSDLHRLAQKGDFNIEIFRNNLRNGLNYIHLFVEKGDQILQEQEIIINYQSVNKWPLPYSINWDKIKEIQDAVEVVDGHWEVIESGVRTKHKYYDRILAIGDTTWENYEVTTSVIFHDYTPPVKGPPTYNVSHVAIATRWPGHDADSLQPNRKWHPLGATAEFRITDNYDSCRWRIFDGENFYAEQEVDDYRQITAGHKYFMKHRVENISDTSTLYSVKFWSADTAEPEVWDFQATENYQEKGSACLIAHHTDVTFGDVSVTPIPTQ